MRVDVCPLGAVRSAGIPFSWLTELRVPEAAADIDAARDADAARAAAAAVDRSDKALRDIAGRRLFALAVDVANPTMHDVALVPYAEGQRARTRRRRRGLAALLQRFAAKNDTAGGFGPMDRVELRGDEPLTQPETMPGQWAQRRGFLGWWTVQAVADAIAADDECAGASRWRMHSLATVEGNVLRVGDRRVKLTADQAGALRAVAEGRAPAEPPPASLRRAGLVSRSLQVPPSQPDPGAWLVDALDGTYGPKVAWWRERLASLCARADAVSHGGPGSRAAALRDLEEELSRLTGQRLGSRAEGRFYADRQVLYEEARGAAASYRLGGWLRADAERSVADVCRLAARYGHARHRQARGWLRERVGGGRVPLTAVAAALDGEPEDLLERERAGDAARLREVVAELARRGDGVIDPAELEERLAGAAEPSLALSSPDLMLDWPEGSAPDLVLGEHHAGLQVFGLIQALFDDRPLHEWLAGAVPGGVDGLAQIVAPRSQGKAYVQELPGAWSVEFGAAALSERRARFGDVAVRWEGAAPILEMPGGERATLLPLDLDNPLYRVLSPQASVLPTVRLGARTPEVRLGTAVMQRARWHLPVPDELPGGDAERFVLGRRWRHAHGLPEQVFVRADNQPKPFYVDFRSPPLTDAMWHWLRGARAVTVTPLQPGEEGLWLRRGEDRFCAELRLSAVVATDENGG